VAAGMAQDFGWQVAAGRYLELYARAVATQR
jgi:glycogen synthase